MKRARILHNEQPVWGIVEGDQIKLESGESVRVDEARYLPPTNPSKITAPHLTYRSRCVEYKMTTIPPEPHIFLMPPTAISYHKATVARPRGCKFLNYEGEVAIVMDKRCYNVTPEEALNYVRGYTIANDWGVHDLRHVDRGAMTRVKGQDGFCPIGPFLVDAADLDPTDLTLKTYVNGEVVQETHTGTDLLFSFAYQIADVARFITLEPGDLLLTGTPANSRPVNIGDVVEVEVSGIGKLQNTVVEMDHDVVKVGFQPEVTAATLHVALAMPEDEAERRVAEYQ
ncbi:MAG: fumarylacetoacetate hydrolase family protein [Anaerolineae bacterium]|nr:fumarylacetoacetate hydrolase family protein [Anaerolineae bacterium]